MSGYGKIQRKEVEESYEIDGLKTRTRITYKEPETSQFAQNVAVLATSAAIISASLTAPIVAVKIADAVISSHNTQCQK
jgi:hypothetical protein